MKRRSFIAIGIATAGLGGLYLGRNQLLNKLLTGRQNESLALSPSSFDTTSSCVLTPEQDEGPFFFNGPVRSDIRENCPGLPFKLKIQIVDAGSCNPIENAGVEIWHCDAKGQYSGHPEGISRKPFDTMRYVATHGEKGSVKPTTDSTWLRGAQHCNNQGIVEFSTIFPGWYAMRATHVHVKVHAKGKSFLTTQLYFPDALVNNIYSTHPAYVDYGETPYTHNNDMVLGNYPDANGLLLEPEDVEGTLHASARLVV